MPSEASPMQPRYMQQEEAASQEFNTFLSTLPKGKGWIVSHLYQYQGFWYPARHLEGAISCQQHFHPQDSDIWLVTLPKSGTTWLKSIMFCLANRSLYPTGTNHPLHSANPHDLVPFMEVDLYGENKIPDHSLFTSPRLFATHVPWVSLPELVKNGSKCKIVYLCRNPKDVFISMWHFCNKLRPHEMGTISITEAFEMFCQGINVYGPCWNHILDYWKQSKENPDRVLFLKYEDVREQPRKHLQQLAKFMGCGFSHDEEESVLVDEILGLCSFENLSNLEVNKNGKLSYDDMKNSAFFRQGKAGDWKNYLSDEMAQKLDRIVEEKLGQSGLFT